MNIVEKKENQIIFTAEVDETIANGIRRYFGQVLVPAIEEAEISKNDSPLYDETVAHRLGLIPLRAEKGMNEKDEATLKLVSKEEGVVYSGELKGNIDVVYDKIPITALTKGQELEIVAKVRMGKGAEHAKFSPGIMFYRNASEIIMDKSLAENVRKVCPHNEIKEKGDKIAVIDNQKKEIADVCEGMGERKNRKVEVKPMKELVITVESFGQMDAKDIFKKSIDALKKDLSEVVKKVSK